MRKFYFLPMIFLLTLAPTFGWGQQDKSNFTGTWITAFSDSVSSGTARLILEPGAEGSLAGLFIVEGVRAGRISGQIQGNQFFFTLIQTAEDCPGSFSGKMTMDGVSVIGTYTGVDCSGEHQNGTLSMVRAEEESISASRETEAETSINEECIVRHEDENYASWLCDPQGQLHPTKTAIYYVRTKRNGDTVPMLVWEGARKEWEEKRANLVVTHKARNAKCLAYFNVSYFPANGEVRWDWVSNRMSKWMKKEGKKKKYKGICYAANPWEADYVVLWTDAAYRVPYSFSIPVPQTSYYTESTSGSVNAYSGGTYGYGTYSGSTSGTVTTYQNQTYSGTRSEYEVLAVVYAVGPNARIVYETKHVGRWRWSKPDKDVLVDSIKFIKERIGSN